jgi:hypothetical protein
MTKDVSFIQYMRAHGNTPAPTQRPLLSGAVAGIAAFVPAAIIFYASGAAQAASQKLASSKIAAIIAFALVSVIVGMVYAWIFGRAANDKLGGWLFGMSFGFLVWIVGPTSVLQLWASEPMAKGNAAMGLFGAHVIHGLVLGAVYPYFSRAFAATLTSKKEAASKH